MVTDLIGVVAVPVKRNYLRHLAPQGRETEGWASRHVHTLCGWVGMAVGCDDGDTSHFDTDGFRVRRRNCHRCELRAAAGAAITASG